MTKFLLVLATLSVFSSTALAEGDGPLAEIMQKMGANFKSIVAQSTDAAKNASSAELTYQFESLVIEAKHFLPPKIEKLTGSEREQKVVLYKVLMNDLVRESLALEEAFLNNVPAEISQQISLLKQKRTQAHDEFREEE